MKRPRFSIASILILVLFVALATAALRAADDLWQSCVFGATLTVLLSAVLLAIHRTDAKRAYWLGFILFGWTYLGASVIPPVESRLPTTAALAYLDSKVPGRPSAAAGRWSTNVNVTNSMPNNGMRQLALAAPARRILSRNNGNVVIWNPTLLAGPNGTSTNFIQIGHCVLALLLAFLGGHLSRFLRGENPNATPAVD